MTPGAGARSPYQRALGNRFAELHPQLQGYFGAIADGHVGHGSGTFDTVGAERWWARAAVRVFGAGVLFPVWERDVPFTVTNRPESSRSGLLAVAAERTFRLRRGDRVMTDRVTTAERTLVDVLGRKRRFRARFQPSVRDAGLQLASTAVEVRVGRHHLHLPAAVAPRIRLTERAVGDGVTMPPRQHIALTVDLPVVGRIYEYSGTFTYELRTGPA